AAPRAPRRRARLLAALAVAALLAAGGGLAAYRLFPRGGALPPDGQGEPFVPRPAPTEQELARRGSPLDGLRWEDVPLPHRAVAGLGDPAKAPKELVAVLSDARFGVSNPGVASWPAVSRDGKVVALPCGPTVSLFDARTGATLRILSGFKGRAYAAA